MKINCLIVEDEPLARNLLIEYVGKISYVNLVEACSSPLAAIEILRTTAIDLLFLDIQMPEITGITLLKILQRRPLVVLTTAYSQYALESYELDVVDYLLKPITFERFLKAVEKVNQRLAQSPDFRGAEKPVTDTPAFVFVKDGTKLVKILIDDILYIEGLKDYVAIYTGNQKIVTLQRIKTLETQLPSNKFIRIHNSYIVALSGIDTIHKERIQIGNKFIPISDSYKKSFREFINRNYLQPPE
ncbi:MAG TPA: LytTR family DNA-binding domain-containing protein [Cytophagales bacterium]|nr:LytTR family DNA-binding domain-containing protein [Cytophagales bacterium]